jgi:predicted  nucleic acid-binding Zn-ribbon protein
MLASGHATKQDFETDLKTHAAIVRRTAELSRLRPKFDIAAAREALRTARGKRDEIKTKLDSAVNALAAAEAAMQKAQNAVATFNSLDDSVATLYAAQIADGAQPSLSTELMTLRTQQQDAIQHQKAVATATDRLRQNVTTAEAAMKVAHADVEAAVLKLLACEGEMIADKYQRLRSEGDAMRRDLDNLAAVRLGNGKMVLSALWLNLTNNAGLRVSAPDSEGMAHWQARARALAAGEIDP